MAKHKGNKIERIVDAPEIILAEDDKTGDVLLKFYCGLGWNGMDILNPCKVRTTEAVYKRILTLIKEKSPKSKSLGMMMVHLAPGVDEGIPYNKVYLFEGWISPDKSKDSC